MASSFSDIQFRVLNGATLEGGGQLLRNSVALAALLRKPVIIDHIRAGRTQPGLKAQHAAGLQLVARICNAITEGTEKGSHALKFAPADISPGNYTADPGTAGSTTLLLQIALPCLLFAREPSRLILRGGTNAIMAPQVDYTQRVFLPGALIHFASRFKDLRLHVNRRGYFPKGGGELEVNIPASDGQPLSPITLLERGKVTSVKGYAFVAGLPANLAHEMRNAAQELLGDVEEIVGATVDISAVREDARSAVGSGSGIVLWAETETGCIIGGSALGTKGKAFPTVAKEAVDELLANLKHGGCVDEYLQDQLIIFMALASGRSSVSCGPLTLHTKTAIWVTEELSGAKFEVEVVSEERNIIHCTGIGFTGPLSG